MFNLVVVALGSIFDAAPAASKIKLISKVVRSDTQIIFNF